MADELAEQERGTRALVAVPPFIFPLFFAVLFVIGAIFSALRFANGRAPGSSAVSLAINLILAIFFGWMTWTLSQTVPPMP